MLTTSPTQQKKKGGKFTLAALLASAVLWGSTLPTMAEIVNSVVATGTADGATIGATATEEVDVIDEISTVSLDKAGTFNDTDGDGIAEVGETISYTFTVQNTGNVTLRNVTLADNKVTPSAFSLLDVGTIGDSTDTAAPGWFNLGIGDSLTASASYTLTPADVLALRVVNNAQVNATTIPGLPVTATDSVTTTFTDLSAFTLDKSGTLALGLDGRADVGDIITYSFVVTNTGPTTLQNVTINDSLLSVAALPGSQRVQDLIQVASIPSDPITTATIETKPIDIAAREPALWQAPVPQLPTAIHAERKLVRLDASDAAFKAGDRIGIYYTLTNTGDVPLTNIEVLQPGAQAFGSSLDILPVNTSDSANIIFTYVLTQEDIDTDQVVLTSGITANARNRTLVSTLRGSMSLLDVQTPDDIATAAVTPALVTLLPPNGQANFSATYALTQNDIDKGKVDNSATASAINTPVVATDSFTVQVPAAPLLRLEKTSSLSIANNNPQKADAGDIITYTFVLTNIGNVTVDNLRIVDAPLGITVPATPINGFAPGASQTFTANYALTAANAASIPRQVVNQATAQGVYGPTSARRPVNQLSDDPATPAVNDPTITPLPAIAIVKPVPTVADTNGSGFTDAGDTLTYRFVVTNVGRITLNNVYVEDRDPNVIHNITPPTGVTLTPGQVDSTSFTATYVIQQADVESGGYVNTADAYGTTPDGKTVTDESDPLVPTNDGQTEFDIEQIFRLAVLKQQTTITQNPANPNAITDLGDTINYNITVVNTGNMPLTSVRVTDPVADGFGTVTIPSIPVGGQYSLPATHVVTAADMLAGEVRNSAFAAVTLPDNTIFRDTSDTTELDEDDPTITPLVARAGVAIVKAQPQILDSNNSLATDAGDTLRYTFTVTNTGNVELSNFVITDTLPGTFNPGLPPSFTLEAGDSDSTVRFDYVLTATDISNGRVLNRARVVATGTGGLNATDSSHPSRQDADADTITYVGAPAIAILKEAYPAYGANNLPDAGEVINYVFIVQNVGSQPLTNVTVTDSTPLVTMNPQAPISLAPGAISNVFTATHVITQSDINLGQFSNSARADGFFGATRVTDDSHPTDIDDDLPTVVYFTQTPGIQIEKLQPTNNDPNGNGVVEPGETLTYRFRITNTGNVTLYDVLVNDLNPNVTPSTLTLAQLGPGEVNTTLTANLLVTAADAEAESISNQAEVRAALTSGGARSIVDLLSNDPTTSAANDPTVTPIAPLRPALSKTAARSEVRRGETVAYTIAASGLGTGPYDIVDIMPTGFDFVAGSAKVNGAAVVPAQSNQTLSFAAIPPTVQGRITVTLTLRASASLATGDFINRGRIYHSPTGALLGEARAVVKIKEEHVFDCGEIVGRVFDDINNNGYMDDGEIGLPGVRVVTVNGLLVTTDKYGRFHVTCADVPNAQIGSNFLMKLDPRTLPVGYVLTSENPRDVRLTRGKITKLNFGASKRRDVALDLTKDAFGKGLDLKPKFAGGIDRLVSLLRQGKGQLTLTYRCGVYAPIADERLDAVAELVQAKWEEEGGNKPLKITKRVECGK